MSVCPSLRFILGAAILIYALKVIEWIWGLRCTFLQYYFVPIFKILPTFWGRILFSPLRLLSPRGLDNPKDSALRFFETSVNINHLTHHYTAGDLYLSQHRCQNLKRRTLFFFYQLNKHLIFFKLISNFCQ